MKSRKLRKSTRKIIITSMHPIIHSVLHKKVFCLTGFRKDEYWMWFWAWNNWFNRFNFIASGHERSWAMPMIRLLLQLRWFFFLSQFINNYLRVLQHQRNFFIFFVYRHFDIRYIGLFASISICNFWQHNFLTG